MLGSGGTTGLAWQAGVLAGLAAAGVEVAFDRLVGTSAGALLGARLATGERIEEVVARYTDPAAVAGVGSATLGAAVVARLLGAQLAPSRRHALALLGRRAERDWTPEASAQWVSDVAGDLRGRAWPASLVVVATDTRTGRPAFLGSVHGVDLAAAVAASCAVPGVFPAVRVGGRLLFDGGLRSPGNLDVAASAGTVLALTPLTGSVRAHRRPEVQAAQLRTGGTRVVLLTPDGPGRRAIGLDVMAAGRVAAAYRAGRALGTRRAGDVRALAS